MSHDDPYDTPPRGPGNHDRGAYTPPTEDDLPFDSAPYQQRPTRQAAGFNPVGNNPPWALIIAGIVLVGIIIAVAAFYSGGLRASEDAPGDLGTPLQDEMRVEAPINAQPINPEAGITVYDGANAPTETAPTFTAPPETVQPRPEPAPEPRPEPRPEPVTPRVERPATPPVVTPPAPKRAETPVMPTGGSASVQIGAFSTPGQAENEYNAVVGRHSQFTDGATRRVQEVTTAGGDALYRTTVGGLSREQATGLCNAIKARGGDCIVR